MDTMSFLTRSKIVEVNRTFRQTDSSHLWPINGRFNVTERAIRHLRYQRRHVEFTYVIEYNYALKDEISRIVNSTI